MSFRKLAAALVLLPALYAAAAGAQTLYTVAGSGTDSIDTGFGTPAVTNYIHLPRGVVSDGNGNLYLTTESGFTGVRKVNLATGIMTNYAGAEPRRSSSMVCRPLGPTSAIRRRSPSTRQAIFTSPIPRTTAFAR